MAEDVISQINEAIDAFTNEKDGAIVTIKKITDVASNRQHYNVSSAGPIVSITTRSFIPGHLWGYQK